MGTPVALITITVMLGMIMAIIDTTIVNVAIQTIGGNLGATVDEVAWVATGYILASVVIMPLNGWLTALLGRKRFYAISLALFTVASLLVRDGALDLGARLLSHRSRDRRRRAAADGAGDSVRNLPAAAARRGDGDLRDGRDGRAGDRADAGRLDHRQRQLAADLLHQRADRHRGVRDDAGLYSESPLHQQAQGRHRLDRAGAADGRAGVAAVRARTGRARRLV